MKLIAFKRDLKPENILYSNKNQDTILKIVDFGIAKTIQSNGKIKRNAGEVTYLENYFLRIPIDSLYGSRIIKRKLWG